MPSHHLLIASTSTVHGSDYLEYLKSEIQEFFAGIPAITFIPFARPGGITHEEYTGSVRKFFESIGIQIIGMHEFPDPVQGVKEARGLFTGGGNTFALLNALYENNLLEVIRERLKAGVRYMGTSAGSNILGPTVQTTNDMPIVYPPSFHALGAVPFNINPHITCSVPYTGSIYGLYPNDLTNVISYTELIRNKVG